MNNVFVGFDARLQAEGKYFRHLFWDGNNLILTAVHWTETREITTRGKTGFSDDCSTVCRHPKPSDERRELSDKIMSLYFIYIFLGYSHFSCLDYDTVFTIGVWRFGHIVFLLLQGSTEAVFSFRTVKIAYST
jgi:hypothetical protein